jgi:hypothetical protein
MNSKIKAIQDEMMARRRELINLQKEQGGVAAVRLESDNLDFCYNPDRKKSQSNLSGEKFYIAGVMCGSPVSMNEFDVYDLA